MIEPADSRPLDAASAGHFHALLPPGALPSNRPLRAAAWMLGASLLFGGMGLSAKLALREVPFQEVAAGRALFGALFVLVWARATGRTLRVRDRAAQWTRTVTGTLSMACGFLALSLLPLGDAITLANLMPLMLALASPYLLNERPSRGLYASGALGLFGVALLAGAEGMGPLASARPAGVAAGILGAVFACVAMAQLRRLGSAESPAGVSLHFLAWAGVAFGLYSVTARVALPGTWPAWTTWSWLVAAGVFGGAAQLAMTRAYGLDDAARVSAVGYSGVLIAQGIGLILGEHPTGTQLAGAALVIASGVWVVLGGRKSAEAARIPPSSS